MQKNYKAEGILYPRAHLSLIGFNLYGYRKFGGIGFSFNKPQINFHVTKSKEMEINLFYNSKKQNSTNEILKDTLNNICQENNVAEKYCFNFLLESPIHSGFGTGTNISLASIESVYKINKLFYTPETLIRKSFRGRTSGIGIQTYFNGGFVMDVGVKNYDNSFIPSNANTSTQISTPLVMHEFPNWEFVVCIPKNLSTLSVVEEMKFFKNFTPLKEKETFEILYVSLYGVTSSIIENDFETFCKAINDLQKTKWKHLERLNYQGKVKKIENKLFKAGAKSVAMSSLGPSLIAFTDNVESFLFNAQKHKEELIFCRATGNNHGRLIYA